MSVSWTAAATAIRMAGGGLLGAAILAGSVVAANAVTRWDMATPYPEGEHHTKNIRAFAEDVSEATDGELHIEVHSGQSIFRSPEIPRAVQDGQIPLGEFILGNLEAEDPIFATDSIPFLATSFEDAAALYEASKSLLEDRLGQRGMRLLFSVPWPSQGFYTNKEINEIGDLEGLTFRTYNAPTARMAELVGARPTIVEAVEIPQAFTTGIVEAMATSAATGVQNKAWDYATHYYDINAWFPKNVVIVNREAFDGLPEEQQQIMLEAAERAEERGWEMAREVAVTSTQRLSEEGMQVPEVSAELMEELRKVGVTMTEEWLERTGDDGKTLIETYESLK